MATPCDKEWRQSYKKTFSPGRVTFKCNNRFPPVVAAPVDAEAKAFPKLLTERRQSQLESFIAQFPKSPLVIVAREKIAALQQEAGGALLKLVKSKVQLGPKPARLVDGRAYTLTLTNPTSNDIVVTIQHETEKEQAVSIAAKSSANVELVTAPSEAPSYKLVAARNATE